MITFKVEVEQEEDGRWLAAVLELPGVLAYGQDQDAAVSKVQALALRVIAERLEHPRGSATHSITIARRISPMRSVRYCAASSRADVQRRGTYEHA